LSFVAGYPQAARGLIILDGTTLFGDKPKIIGTR
jgi:hypothetical protein